LSRHHPAAWLLPALLTIAAPAQEAGQPAPDIEWRATFNFGQIKNQRLSQLRGSAVLLEFWGTH
jgi:hypothetical protein